MVFHAVKAEEKKVPLRPDSEELITVDAGKKRRSSTESGSSSNVASETIASRMKRAKRAVAVTSKGPIDLDPIEEEVDKPKEAGALTAIPEPTVMIWTQFWKGIKGKVKHRMFSVTRRAGLGGFANY